MYVYIQPSEYCSSNDIFILETKEHKIQIIVSRIKFLFKAIHGFRETEKSHWNVENLKIINKIKQLAFDEKDIIPASHVLDLAEDG